MYPQQTITLTDEQLI